MAKSQKTQNLRKLEALSFRSDFTLSDVQAARDGELDEIRNAARVVEGTLNVEIYDAIFPGLVSASWVAAKLAEHPNLPVNLYINSPGGSVFEGIAIMHIVQRRNESTGVTAIVDGIAASAASVIAMGAGRIEAASAASSILVHRAWGLGMGNALDFGALAEELSRIDNQLAEVYAARTGMGADAILDIMSEDNLMPAAEAAELKFIDGVNEAPSQPAQNRMDDSDFRATVELANLMRIGV